MGFGASIQSKNEKDMGKLLKDILPGDLLKFGLIPEFVGRLPIVVTLETLDKNALVSILSEPKNALVKQYKKLFELDDVTLDFEDGALEAIAEEALNRNTGARGLRSIIEEIMRDIMFDIPSDEEIHKVIITKESVKTKQPLFERVEGQKRLPMKPKKAKNKKGIESA